MERNEKITKAKQQIAEKWKCSPDVFDGNENIFIPSVDTFFEIITFGTNAVIRADEAIVDWCCEKYSSVPARDIMDGDNLYELETKLRAMGKKLGGEHIGYLHVFPERTVMKPDGFTYRLFVGQEIEALQTPENRKDFDNAFSPDKERDVLAIAAYDGNTIAAIAGSDDYLDAMWQIGIDTLPAYRKRGLGAYLVKEIALEIEKRHKIAYYNTWSPNIASTRVALSIGFCPVWMGYPSVDV